MTEITIPNNFEPRPYQVPFMRYMDNGGRQAICIWHRRGGKDLCAMHQTCKMMHRRKGVYWHVFPTAEQGKKAIWEGFTRDGSRIMEQVFPLAIRKSPREWRPSGEMVVELKCGSIWRLLGSDKVSLVGAGPVGVVFSEYAVAKPSAWEYIRPMLAENDGWAAFISTPRGENHCKALYDAAREPGSGWFHDLRTLEQTRAYDPERTLAEARASGMPEALIRQEYLCDWTAANVGSVWGDLIEQLEKAGAVAEFEPDGARAFTTWDLGGSGARGDSTAFWLWEIYRDGVSLLDYYENHGKTLEHYWDEVDSRCAAAGVRPVKNWLPHDARAKHLTGVSVLEQCLQRWGSDRVAIYPEENLGNGIQAGRWLLQRSVRIHPRCRDGISALKEYHYAWDEDRKTLGNKPKHDWSSHGADAFRGLALVVKRSEMLTRQEPKKQPKTSLRQPPTLDELFSDADANSGAASWPKRI